MQSEEGGFDVPVPIGLLYGVHSAYAALYRSGLPLDPDWPPECEQAFEALGDLLYPADGPTPHDRGRIVQIGDVCDCCDDDMGVHPVYHIEPPDLVK